MVRILFLWRSEEPREMFTEAIPRSEDDIEPHSRKKMISHDQQNITGKKSDSNSPLLLGEGATNSQAFWQVKRQIHSIKICSEEDPSKTIGFIPLLQRSDVFHSLKGFPLISFMVKRSSLN